MEDRLQKMRAFYLTGRTDGTFLKPKTKELRPALFARFSDLSELRYDYPLILNKYGGPERALVSLSALVDDAVELLEGDERDRAARLAYAVEDIIRRQLDGGEERDFRTLWNEAAAAKSGGNADESEALNGLWRSFRCEGELLEATAETASKAIRHLWDSSSGESASAMKERITRLIVKLEGILAAEAAGSAAGRSPERLMAGVGNSYASAFDFEAMSQILSASKPESKIGDERRERIQSLISELKDQKFYPADGADGYGFFFEHPSDALNAYIERHADAVRFLKNLRMAELESAGDYRESVHGPIFESFGESGLDPDDLADLPVYLVCCEAESLEAGEVSDLVEMLAAGVPFKVLVRTDDILSPSSVAEGHVSVGLRARQLVQTAIGLTDVFVIQTPASRLFGDRASLLDGLNFPGPALFSVYSGAPSESSELDPYLASAAALASRAFPAIVFDPSEETDRPPMPSIEGNPSIEDDWESHEILFEDETLQAHTERAAFTFADLLATDERFSRHFALVEKDEWGDEMVPLSEMPAGPDLESDVLPYVTLAGPDGDLHRALADHLVVRETRRCRSMWLTLRETGLGRKTVETEIEETQAQEIEPEKVPEVEAASAPEEKGPATDEPYIETSRCTSCNECTQLNAKMFAYDENKQAYIKDPDAGTFRELVEAAESCQVGIIHPGKPRNPKEPGLEDLIKRAEDFQ